MKSMFPFTAVLVVFLLLPAANKNDTPTNAPADPPSNPFTGKYLGKETIYKLSHVLPPNAGSYDKTIEVFEENGQTKVKDDSITVVLNNKGYYEHNYSSSTPGDQYTYIIEIRNDSLFKHLNRFTGTLWVFSGVKQK